MKPRRHYQRYDWADRAVLEFKQRRKHGLITTAVVLARTYDAVRTYASKQGILQRPRWSATDKDYLLYLRRYKNASIDDLVTIFPDRSRSSIITQLSKMRSRHAARNTASATASSVRLQA